METLETIAFEGETIKVCQDENGYEVREGILKGNNYSVEVFPPIGDDDYDPYNRNYIVERRGIRVKVEHCDLLVAEPIVIPRARLESRKITKVWPDIDKEWVDYVAEEIITQANNAILNVHLFANSPEGGFICFCKEGITSFSFDEAQKDPKLKKHLRHKRLCEF